MLSLGNENIFPIHSIHFSCEIQSAWKRECFARNAMFLLVICFVAIFCLLFHARKWVCQPWTGAPKLHFCDYYYQVSLCQSILWHVHHPNFAYICIPVRQQETTFFFLILLQIPEALKNAFPLISMKVFIICTQFGVIFYKSSILTRFYFIYIKIHDIIFFFANT